MCPLYHVSHMAICSFQTSGRTSFSALNLFDFFHLWPLDLLLKGLTLLRQAHCHARRWDYTGCVYQGLGILGTIFQFWLAQHTCEDATWRSLLLSPMLSYVFKEDKSMDKSFCRVGHPYGLWESKVFGVQMWEGLVILPEWLITVLSRCLLLLLLLMTLNLCIFGVCFFKWHSL